MVLVAETVGEVEAAEADRIAMEMEAMSVVLQMAVMLARMAREIGDSAPWYCAATRWMKPVAAGVAAAAAAEATPAVKEVETVGAAEWTLRGSSLVDSRERPEWRAEQQRRQPAAPEAPELAEGGGRGEGRGEEEPEQEWQA